MKIRYEIRPTEVEGEYDLFVTQPGGYRIHVPGPTGTKADLLGDLKRAYQDHGIEDCTVEEIEDSIAGPWIEYENN